MTINPGAAVRDWLNARDVRRWERRGTWPPTLERSYWTAYEYQRDLGRLQQRMYRVTLERASKPYHDMTPNVSTIGPRQIRARSDRQALLYRVSYERLSYSTWAGTVSAAQRS
jgi:hypothetical protein